MVNSTGFIEFRLRWRVAFNPTLARVFMPIHRSISQEYFSRR